MSDEIRQEGFQSSELLAQLAQAFAGMSAAERTALMKKTNGVFELRLKSGGGQEGVWTIDMKKDGRVYAGAAKPKADVTLLMDDGVFMQMAAGELDGQKAYLSGKLKTKGNMMLATKLTAVLQAAKSKAKL